MDDAPSKAAPGVKTLVRGPDGTLYLLSEDKPPLKLEGNEAVKVEEFLTDTETTLTKIIAELAQSEMSCTHNIHVTLPEVFMP